MTASLILKSPGPTSGAIKCPSGARAAARSSPQPGAARLTPSTRATMSVVVQPTLKIRTEVVSPSGIATIARRSGSDLGILAPVPLERGDLLAQRVPPVARERGLRSLQHLVGHGVDRTRQPAQEAGHVAVARVDVRRDLLQ